jgi:hypothetical protein
MPEKKPLALPVSYNLKAIAYPEAPQLLRISSLRLIDCVIP